MNNEENIEDLVNKKCKGGEYVEELQKVLTKCNELDGIQMDINDLMHQLNTFIADNLQGNNGRGDCSLIEEEFNIDNSNLNDIYISDGSNPTEVNWKSIGPVIQKHISDLQRIHKLNELTQSVTNRIRNVAQLSVALKGETQATNTLNTEQST